MKTQSSFQFVLVAAGLAVATATASLPVLAAKGTLADECAGEPPRNTNNGERVLAALGSHLKSAMRQQIKA